MGEKNSVKREQTVGKWSKWEKWGTGCITGAESAGMCPVGEKNSGKWEETIYATSRNTQKEIYQDIIHVIKMLNIT